MKAIFVLRLVLVSALLVTMTVPTSYAPLAAATPVDNQSTSFQTPPSDVVSADSEQSLARAAIEAALAKERSHDGQARQATPVQVTVEGEWGYATLAEPQDGRTASEPVTVLARRLPSGEWQAVTPRDFEAYNQWLESVPETLLASTMKEQIRTQITPTPEVTTVEQVTAQPTATPTPSVSTSPNVELSTNIQISRTIAHTTTFYLPVILGEKWTLYSSKRFGYSIQYPPEYRVVDRQEIQPTADSSGVPSDVWFNDHIHVISRIPSLPNDLVTRLWSSAQKIILVSGFSAYRREYLSQPIEDESSERSKPVLSIEYLVRHKGADYFLIYESSTNDSYYITTQEIFEQMVNSFQVLPEYTYSPSTVEAAAAAATAFDFFVDPPNGATRSPSYASYNARNPYLTNTAPCYNKPYSQLQHTAEDWFRPASTNVYAVANGRVVWSRDENYPGAVVII